MSRWLRSPARAVGYALVLLAVGFVWGAVSANVAALRTAPAILLTLRTTEPLQFRFLQRGLSSRTCSHAGISR